MIVRRHFLQGLGAGTAAIAFGSQSAAAPLPQGLSSSFTMRAQDLDHDLNSLWVTFSRVKQSFELRNLPDLWEVCYVPLLVVNKGELTPVTSEAGLITLQTVIFAPKIRDAVLGAGFESLFLNCYGAMIGDGELWMGDICVDPGCAGSNFRVSTIDLFE